MKLFYDNFSERQIAGVFTPTHFLVATMYFVLSAAAVFFSRKMTKRGVRRATFIAAIVCDVMEVIKIVLRIVKGMKPDSFIPLYVSSLFLYASWLSLLPEGRFQRAGLSFLSFGSTTAGICYMCYPSTSLLLYPLWHPASIHGILYHWIILYIGLMNLIKLYRPEPQDFFEYFLFFTAFTIPALIYNSATDGNLMFLNKPFALPPLQAIYNYFPPMYLVGSFLAQAVALYWVWYGGTKLVLRLYGKRHPAEDADEQLAGRANEEAALANND